MFFKAASHPAILISEITEGLILSGRDTIILVVFPSLETWTGESGLLDCWGTLLKASTLITDAVTYMLGFHNARLHAKLPKSPTHPHKSSKRRYLLILMPVCIIPN